MKAISYVPHGAVPDLRGNAPAIVAQEFVRHFRLVAPHTVCDREIYTNAFEIERDYGPIHRLRVGRVYRRLFQKITRLDPYPLHARAARIADRVGADVFHAHQLEFPVADFLRRTHRRPTVLVHMHVYRTFKEELGVADCYVAVSEYARRRSIEERGYPTERVVVVHNGVDTERFRPPLPDERVALRAVLGIPPEAVVVSYVGRKASSKGYLAFLRAMNHLFQKRRDVYGVSVGMITEETRRHDGELEEIVALLTELRAHPRFHDFAPIAHVRLPAIYQLSDIVHFATYSDHETFGLVAAEAQASGCVLLGARHAAMHEIVRDGVTGFLVPDPRNVDDVIDRTENVVDRLESLGAMRTAARAWARQRFDWSVVAQRLERLYFGLVSGEAPAVACPDTYVDGTGAETHSGDSDCFRPQMESSTPPA